MSNSARNVIDICGGVGVVATWVGRNRSTVHRWTMAVADGGTGGVIPQRYHQAMLDRATASDVPLRPEHFLTVTLPPARQAEGSEKNKDAAP